MEEASCGYLEVQEASSGYLEVQEVHEANLEVQEASSGYLHVQEGRRTRGGKAEGIWMWWESQVKQG